MVASAAMDRCDFIKIVIAGGVASSLGCPADTRRGGPARADGGGSAPAQSLRAEINTWCHAVRDGTEFRMPRSSRHVPVVIVGGGAAGLMAARALGDRHYLLIEKEPVVGGNATGGSWRGVGFSSGTSRRR